jgi:Uncharacterised nucleotidyltransferase
MSNFTFSERLLLTALLPNESSQQLLSELLTVSANEIIWEDFFRLCPAKGLSALVRYNFSLRQNLANIPVKQRDELENSSHIAAAKHLLSISEIKRLTAIFQAEKIDSIPLKGAALMLGNYYPKPGLRSVIDLDLLIDPAQTEHAFAVALANGFRLEPIPPSRAAQPLSHELRHLPLLRNEKGLLLELHFRAFHSLRANRDFAMQDMMPRTVLSDEIYLPSAEDLGLHLIQHTVADLTSANSILRTLADLYFITQKDAAAFEKIKIRAKEFDLSKAVTLAFKALTAIESNDYSDHEVKFFVQTALAENSAGMMETVRLFEYLDLREAPVHKLKHLLSLARGRKQNDSPALQEKSSVFSMIKKFNWKALRIKELRRIARLRKMVR